MGRLAAILWSIFLLVVALAVTAWILARWMRRSDDDPSKLVTKWIASAIIIAGLAWVLRDPPDGYAAAFVLPIAGLICGVAMAVLWGRNIAGWFARPFENLFTGGELEPDPEPVYSIAETKRRQGKYREAITEIQKQIELFPRDVRAHVMLAQIRVEHLNDLPGAQLVIERFCRLSEVPPKHVAYALSTLADWHLKFAQDIEAARQALESIGALLPGTPEAQVAAQRIAHLGDTRNLVETHDRPAVKLKPGIDNVGLIRDPDLAPKRPTEDLAATAGDLVRHLEAHPLDTEARERLAVIYGGYYQRLDLATGELEQLIQHPNHSPKHIVRWLNVLADLQMKSGAELDVVRQTLQRIIDLNPEVAAAGLALQRMAHLKLETRNRDVAPSIQLGTYEQNIGIKKGRPGAKGGS